MKRIIFVLFSMVLLATSMSFAQSWGIQAPGKFRDQKINNRPSMGNKPFNKCNNDALLVDSMTIYSWDGMGTWLPNQVQVYEYNSDGLPGEIVTLDANTRDSLFRANFQYINGNQTYYYYESYSGEWSGLAKRYRFYNSLDQLESEVFEKPTDSGWYAWRQFIYTYNPEGKTDFYRIQWKNNLDQWYDFSVNYYLYNPDGSESERYEQRVEDDVVFWRSVMTYDPFGKVTSRTIQNLKLDVSSGSYLLKDRTRTNYLYDEYWINDEIINETHDQSTWMNASRILIHRSYDAKSKIKICLNGKEQCISIKFLPRFIRMGATIGECPDLSLSQQSDASKLFKSFDIEMKDGYTVYPNPATNSITIDFHEKADDIDLIEIIDMQGRLVISINKIDPLHNPIDISHLSNGLYYVRMTGKTVHIHKIIKH